MGVVSNLKLKHFPRPLAPPGSYDGQRVLVAGGTTGLGLAAAVHFVNLGAREVTITARASSRGQAAKKKIEAQTGTAGQNRVNVAELDMSQYSSVEAFVEQLRREQSTDGGFDCIVLNAGVFNASFVESSTGW